jgi:hypothetical protein
MRRVGKKKTKAHPTKAHPKKMLSYTEHCHKLSFLIIPTLGKNYYSFSDKYLGRSQNFSLDG